jgi:hypothetical protein
MAMAVNDAPAGFLPWGSNMGSTQTTDLGANQYEIYGGINGLLPGSTTEYGNTYQYCKSTAEGADCTSPGDSSAFAACTLYSDGVNANASWYLPSMSEMLLMYMVAQIGYMNTISSGSPNDYNFSQEFYWSSTQYNGELFVYEDNSVDPSSFALGFTFLANAVLPYTVNGGYQYGIDKNGNGLVRCVQAF